jgi:hypothetical protein
MNGIISPFRKDNLLPKLSRKEITEEGENDTTVKITVVRPEPDYSKLSIEELKILQGLMEKLKLLITRYWKNIKCLNYYIFVSIL